MLKRLFNFFKQEDKQHQFEGELNIANVINFYKSMGIDLASGVSEKEITTLEQELELSFPEDYKAFHRKCNGFSEWGMDQNNFSIWTFDRILKEYTEEKQEDKNFIPICGYLINSHHFGYLKGEIGIYNNFDQREPIATTFVEFLGLLVTDSKKLY